MRKVIGIGETILDIIFRQDQPSAAVPGGSAFNAMISLGRTLGKEGIECGMITETGDDHIGEIVVNFMRQNHVSTDYVTIRKGTQSHISLAFLNERNDAQYEFYKDHKHASLNPIPSSLQFRRDDLVLFGSFFAINPVIRSHTKALFSAAHEAGAILYYDINFRKSHIADIPDTIGNIIENFKMADVVRGSTEDFGFLFGTSDPKEVYEKHLSQHCRLFICTDGANPITLFTPSISGAKFEVAQVKTVSTIGAGDNFNAGFLYGLMKDDIRHDQLSTLDLEGWSRLIASGQRFSSNVCQSIYNYVDFGDQLLM